MDDSVWSGKSEILFDPATMSGATAKELGNGYRVLLHRNEDMEVEWRLSINMNNVQKHKWLVGIECEWEIQYIPSVITEEDESSCYSQGTFIQRGVGQCVNGYPLPIPVPASAHTDVSCASICQCPNTCKCSHKNS